MNGLFVDLTGQKFGKYTALYYDKELHKWHCKCECGAERDIFAANLKYRNQKKVSKCTCKNRDLTGETIGSWTVLYAIDKPGQKVYHCRCVCGTERDVFASNLIKGKTSSCGCQRIQGNINRKLKRCYSLVGKKVDKLFVEAYNEDDKTYTCRCECGCVVIKTDMALSTSIRNNSPAWCNDYSNHPERPVNTKDITGNRYGHLIATERTDDFVSPTDPDRKIGRWHCKCDCGNTRDVLAWQLKTGVVTDCSRHCPYHEKRKKKCE